jgi:dTDP-4-dehydrorhamnose reductase
MNILILGSTGMLGNAVTKYFISKTKYNITVTHRDPYQKLLSDSVYFDPTVEPLDKLVGYDYVINCIGIIKPFIEQSIENSININSLFPRKLANHCEKNNIKLIHITTDCVFSGRDGNYNEKSPHDCTDIYGKTKSLGEPDNCMVLRTSIIGDEIHKNASLIAWAKSNTGKEVNGFINHIWNGVTTTEYASVCHQIIEKNLFKKELFHIYSNTVTKYELLQLINKYYELNLKINMTSAVEKIDRTLSTVKVLELKIAPLEKQIEQIAKDFKLNSQEQIVS